MRNWSCDSVIVANASATQKAWVAAFLRKSLHPSPCILAVGDGANDVPMFQEADCRVAIAAKDGIVNRCLEGHCDFQIENFGQLRRVLMRQGRDGYRRASVLALHSLFKAVLTMTGAAIYFPVLFHGHVRASYLLFHFVYTSLPVLVVATFDTDLCDEIATQMQAIYISSRRRSLFEKRSIWGWVIDGLTWGGTVALFYIAMGEVANGGGKTLAAGAI
eukprot:Polyplicarium_translucidae@DN3830_c0_g1_i1.p1